MHQELHKSRATLQLLWSEYQEAVATRGEGLKPYQYSQFCELYSAWRVRLRPSMRQVHRAGEKAFLDYSGRKPKIFDAHTSEAREVELSVMVLGASNYTYAEATNSQQLRDFVGATIRGFEDFGGVPEVIVPDQLRSAVKGPDRYEPDLNATYPGLPFPWGFGKAGDEFEVDVRGRPLTDDPSTDGGRGVPRRAGHLSEPRARSRSLDRARRARANLERLVRRDLPLYVYHHSRHHPPAKVRA